MPRRRGLEYHVEHQVRADGTERLLILHNDHAENFELAEAPLDRPGEWTPVIGHRADTRLLAAAAFAEYTVVYLRRNALTGLRILRQDGSEGIPSGSWSVSWAFFSSSADSTPSTPSISSPIPIPRHQWSN